jgi:hypothetical protein
LSHTKICARCNAEKELSEFNKMTASKDGHQPYCRPCGAAYLNTPERRASARAYKNAATRTLSGRCVALLKNAEARAKDKGLPCTITLAWITERVAVGHCAVTGLPFAIEEVGRGLSPSLDQIIPGLGYTPENTQVVCWLYNRAKGVEGHDAVMMLAEALCNK